MSQIQGTGGGGGGGAGEVETLTGNVGGPVSPTAHNINIVGAGSISVTGDPGTSTLTISSSGGGGVTSLMGDSGPPYAGAVIISGTTANVGTMRFYNSAPNTVFMSINDGNNNLILGSGGSIPSGAGNIAFGHVPFLGGATTGDLNTCFGYQPFNALTSGSHNACFGQQPLLFLTTGSYNMVASAFQGGVNYTGAESSNININASATTVTGESNVLRIGDGTGTGVQQLSAAYISGIAGVNVGSVASVLTNSGDQLGTATITAGTGISVTPGANTITIATTLSGTGKSFFGTASTTLSSIAAASFIAPYQTASVAVGSLVPFACPVTGTLSNLYVNVATNAATTGTAVTLFKNGASTAVTVTITALTTGVFSDTTHSVAVAAGDLLSWQIAQSATGVIVGSIGTQLVA